MIITSSGTEKIILQDFLVILKRTLQIYKKIVKNSSLLPITTCLQRLIDTENANKTIIGKFCLFMVNLFIFHPNSLFIEWFEEKSKFMCSSDIIQALYKYLLAIIEFWMNIEGSLHTGKLNNTKIKYYRETLLFLQCRK